MVEMRVRIDNQLRGILSARSIHAPSWPHTGRAIEWTRIALPQAQINADRQLLNLVIEKTDNRANPPRKYLAVECEAVGQVTLEAILRVAIERRLPEPLDTIQVREAVERSAVIELLRQHTPRGP
jgi:hypothetical protein